MTDDEELLQLPDPDEDERNREWAHAAVQAPGKTWEQWDADIRAGRDPRTVRSSEDSTRATESNAEPEP